VWLAAEGFMADVGTAIGGYRLRSLLQTGQVSQVYEVVEPASGRHFAMKVLLPEAAAKSDVRANLFHEADVGIKLRHENIIHILKVNRDKETPHFIMEFFPSGSMRARLMQKDFNFIKENAHKIFKQMATGLAYMHANGWVHCDVKPDNLLVNALGQLRIIDFAISKKVPTGMAKWFYRRKKAQGTPSFMAPEQIRGQLPDPRSDIYSFGATMFELLTGRPPFRGKTMSDLLNKHISDRVDTPQVYNKDITDEMAALIVKMLAKKKEDRPKDCHEILFALKKMQVYKSQPLAPSEESMGM
jgi:eukaryotic-like serine/threonine-protein kinase